MTPTEPASLALKTSNRLTVLLDDLAARLADDPLPPLEREVIVVQSLGMERWLRLELARRLGIAGHLDFPFPATLLGQLADPLLDAQGTTSGPREPDETTAKGVAEEASKGSSREALTWRCFAALSSAAEASADGTSGTNATPELYLADDPDQRKRYQLATRLANLFEDYQMFRPDMVLAWEAGETPSEGPGAWQAPLWRQLMDASPGAGTADTANAARPRNHAHRFTELLHWLERHATHATTEARQALLDRLPRRLSVFGVSTLPPLVLRLLVALARCIPVRLYFVSPTYHYWGDLRSERELARIDRRLRSQGRRLDEAHFATGHRLLSGLGRQGRDFFNLLQDVDRGGDAWHELAFEEPEGATVLARLQRGILHLEEPGAEGVPRHTIDPDDRSLAIHVVHSPRREMEVLHDELLAAFAEEPALRPDHVLVLLSDVERYSPYIEAVFGHARGAGDGDSATPRIPYSIADRRAGASRPLAEAALRVLELVSARRTLGEVFDLLETTALRRRFDLTASELTELRPLLDRARIRWGADGRQRADDFDLPAEDANTWREGLDRLLLGATTGRVDALVSGSAPLSGDLAGDLDALGRLVALVDTLFAHLDGLRHRRSPGAWAEAIGALLDDLFAPDDEDDEEALQLVRDALDTLRRAELDGVEEPIDLEVVRRHLHDRLEDDGGPGPFLTGRITFCALKPMRTIPFDLVWVAGLDDGVFPRRDPPQGFDLVRRTPQLGDRSLRDDDRYLFLETLLAARQRLLLSTVGRSQQDGSERSPSVVLAELLDHLDRGFVADDGRPARERLVVEHRLHPFHAAYFDPEGGPLFSYSQRNLEAAQALLGPRQETPSFYLAGDGTEGLESTGVTEPSDEGVEPVEIELDDLVRFWIDPCRHYARRVLGIDYADEHRQLEDDAEPFETTGLGGYQVLQELLKRRLQDLDPSDDELAWLRARGEIPLAGLGAAEYQALCERVAVLVAAIPRHERRPPHPLELDFAGARVHGRLDDLTAEGPLRFRCAAVRGKDRLRAWIRHLAWNLDPAEQTLPRTTRVVGEDPTPGRRERSQTLRFRPVAEPRPLLQTLVDGYLQGLEAPLPVFPEASRAWAEQRLKVRGGSRAAPPQEAARRAFLGQRAPGQTFSAADRDNPYIQLCFRGREPLETPDFPSWSERLWGPLLDHEEQGP